MTKHNIRAAKQTLKKRETPKSTITVTYNRQHEVIGRVTDPELRTYGGR